MMLQLQPFPQMELQLQQGQMMPRSAYVACTWRCNDVAMHADIMDRQSAGSRLRALAL